MRPSSTRLVSTPDNGRHRAWGGCPQVKIGVAVGKILIKSEALPVPEHDDGRTARVTDQMRGPGVLKSSMIADYLRSHAHWRLDRAEEPDDGRNARSAVALLDAAAYTQGLDDSAQVLVRMADAGCFVAGGFDPGAEAVRIIRGWRYVSAGDGGASDPAALLEAVAGAAERSGDRDAGADHDRADGDRAGGGGQGGGRSDARSKTMAGSRRRAKSRARRRHSP